MSEPDAHRLLAGVTGLAAELTVPGILRRVVRTAAELTGARSAAFAVLDSEDGEGATAEVVGDPGALYGGIAVPVRVHGELFGHLYLDGPSEVDAPARRLAVAAGIALRNARLFERTRLRERWLEASQEVTAALLGGTDPGPALRLIARRARTVSRASLGAIARPLPGDPATLRFEVVDTNGTLPDPPAGLTVSVEGSATGRAFATGEPVVVRDYGRHVAAYQGRQDVRLPSLVERLDSAVAVPLLVGTARLGVLVVAKVDDDVPFSPDEVRLVRAFAAQAALALEFARAAEDRERLAVFEDRDRIARDLHDLVIQRLFAIGLGLEGLSRLSGDQVVADRVSGFVHELDRTIRDIRNSIFSLQEPDEVQGGLRSELLRLTLDSAGTLGFEPSIGFEGPLDTAVPDPVRTDLVATLREALSNVARHSGASTAAVEVTVDREGKRLALTVTDDGKGIPERPDRRSGLRNLAERARRWGGTLSVRGRPGQGTTLDWTAFLPRDREESER
ncbi:GAF domain-containing sensor histidine kinase [Prauserella shujinwangii]|uniref:GAF domain-containing sensor histidine kinase n=1 Tax=Prauserella shujinwangii TaxID=1453103 RepID=UPI001FEA2AAA|nr:GAF domain-containing protein [Prauserella shujinwangii]